MKGPRRRHGISLSPSRALGQPETGGLVRPVCGVSAANRAARSRTKRLLSRHRRRSGDDTARERELRLNTALVESTADQHRAHSQRSVPSSRWSVVARENRRSGDHTSIRIRASIGAVHPYSRDARRRLGHGLVGRHQQRPPPPRPALAHRRRESHPTLRPSHVPTARAESRDGHARHELILAPGGRARRAPGCCLHRRWLLWRPRTRSNLQESLLRPALPRLCRGGPYRLRPSNPILRRRARRVLPNA